MLEEDASLLYVMHFLLILHFFLEVPYLLSHHFYFPLCLFLSLVDVECHFLFFEAFVQLEILMQIFDNSILFSDLIIKIADFLGLIDF